MMRNTKTLLIAGILFAVFGCSDSTDESNTNDQVLKELAALNESVKQIQEDLAQIKQKIDTTRRASRPTQRDILNVELDTSAGMSRGSVDASLTLIEFTDYQCPFCARFKRDSFPRLAREYVDTGKVRYIVMDLPLERIHPLAFKAAEAVHCAGEQDKFWDMHARLFANQKQLQPWGDHATGIGLDPVRFDECLDTGTYASVVRRSLAEAAKISISGTPTFVIGTTSKSDRNSVKGLRMIRGARPFESFKAVIDSLSSTVGG